MSVPQNCLLVPNLSFVPFVFARIVTVQLPVLDEAVVDLFNNLKLLAWRQVILA